MIILNTCILCWCLLQVASETQTSTFWIIMALPWYSPLIHLLEYVCQTSGYSLIYGRYINNNCFVGFQGYALVEKCAASKGAQLFDWIGGAAGI